MRNMTGLLATLLMLVAGTAGAGDAPGPACEVHKSRAVSFRSAKASDVMDVAVSPGPCAQATLTITIRSDAGRVLYAYRQSFEQHVVHTDTDPLHLQAVPFVDRLIADGVDSSATLPPWQEPDAYEAQHAGVILIDRAAYERLRTSPRPLFSHPTYFEGWRSVVWDEAKGQAVTIIEGGS